MSIKMEKPDKYNYFGIILGKFKSVNVQKLQTIFEKFLKIFCCSFRSNF